MTLNGFDVQRIFLDIMNGKSVATLQLLIAQRRNVTDVGRTHNHGPPQLIPPLRPGNHSHTLAHNIKLRHQSSQQPAHTLLDKILKKKTNNPQKFRHLCGLRNLVKVANRKET